LNDRIDLALIVAPLKLHRIGTIESGVSGNLVDEMIFPRRFYVY
jgi:hypothetical protein